MRTNNIESLVADAVKASPLPERFEDLDAESRGLLTRQAAEQEPPITPEQLYAVIRATVEKEAADAAAFDPDAVAKAARR